MLRALLSKLSVRIYAIVLVSMIMILSLTQIILSISYDTSFGMREQHLSDVVDTVVSNLDMLEKDVQAGNLSREEAQAIAQERIMSLNYDEAGYFFAFDKSNTMIAHPTKPEWIGQDMSSYADTRGTNIFVAMTSLVKEQGRGTITYFFNKPNSDGDEEKLATSQNFSLGDGLLAPDPICLTSKPRSPPCAKLGMRLNSLHSSSFSAFQPSWSAASPNL